jgi:hypothetical protein
MKALLSLLTGAALVAYLGLNIHHHGEPWAANVINMCTNPTNHADNGPWRVVYTGISSILDRALCVIIYFTQQPLHDILGAPLMRLMWGAFGTIYALMAFEGSRQGFKNTTLLPFFPLLALLANFAGIFAVFPLIWVPMSVYYSNKSNNTKDTWNISMPQAYGILLAVILGYGFPSAIIASPLVANDSKLEQDLLLIWLVLPMFVAPLIPVCESLFHKLGSPVDTVLDTELKQRLLHAEGKDALERSYLFLGILNMLLYYGCFWSVSLEGIRVWDSLLMLLNTPFNLPADLSFVDLSLLSSTRVVLVDFLGLTAGFVLWALFESGPLPALVVLVLSPIVGPAAAVSCYAYYREGQLCDLSSTEEVTISKTTTVTSTTTTRSTSSSTAAIAAQKKHHKRK